TWAMSSTPTPASSNTVRAMAPIAGDECRSARSDTNQWSWASAPAHANTQRSSGTPADRAASTEHMIRAAAWSVSRLAFMAFVYGNPIMRLSAVTVPISAAVLASRDQAQGLAAATWLKRDQRAATLAWWSSIDSPAVARR